MEKKSILCFGDSNTWGYNGKNGTRFDSDTRWTGRLETMLGDKYKVIEEGQNGRTILMDDLFEGFKNGLQYLQPCLQTHDPLDYFVLLLGTNDLKSRFNLSAFDVSVALKRFMGDAEKYWQFNARKKPEVLILSPVYIEPEIKNADFSRAFTGHDCIGKSKEIYGEFKNIAKLFNYDIIDLSRYAKAGKADGLHLDELGHLNVAQAVYKWFKEKEKVE